MATGTIFNTLHVSDGASVTTGVYPSSHATRLAEFNFLNSETGKNNILLIEKDGIECTTNESGSWATRWKVTPVPFQSSGAFAKYGRFVTMSYRTWQLASNITVPTDYRPWGNMFFVGEQRDGNTISYARLVVNTNGTITLSGSNTEFVGTFTWAIY